MGRPTVRFVRLGIYVGSIARGLKHYGLVTNHRIVMYNYNLYLL